MATDSTPLRASCIDLHVRLALQKLQGCWTKKADGDTAHQATQVLMRPGSSCKTRSWSMGEVFRYRFVVRTRPAASVSGEKVRSEVYEAERRILLNSRAEHCRRCIVRKQHHRSIVFPTTNNMSIEPSNAQNRIATRLTNIDLHASVISADAMPPHRTPRTCQIQGLFDPPSSLIARNIGYPVRYRPDADASFGRWRRQIAQIQLSGVGRDASLV